MVVDTSILLAVVFNESNGPWCVKELEANVGHLLMSSVNYAETLILIADRQPALAEQLQEQIASLAIRFVAPSMLHAEIAAKARLEFPLNLGDCFAYGLAKAEGCSLLTLDRDFRNTDLTVVLPAKA